MSLRGLFASMRALRRRSSQQRTEEEGAEISRRLQESLDVTKPKRVKMPFTKAHSGIDPGHVYREKTGTQPLVRTGTPPAGHHPLL